MSTAVRGGRIGHGPRRPPPVGQAAPDLEEFGPVHNRGSSHGGSRINRQSYFQDPCITTMMIGEKCADLLREDARTP
ncbi:hypothetical protein [Streptomyces phaeoluteigriseus]